MSVISTNNTNPLAPIDRTSETNPLISRFNQQSIDIYGKFSIYQDGTRRRDSEPFLFTDLNRPNSVKLRRKNDSQTLPFRSALDDIQRMSRFLRSGRGLLFSAQQFLIQNQNAFNETRVWNPASILTAAGSTPLLRIRPLRHIETSGGIGGILTNFLRGSIGLTPNKSKPSGTATSENVISNRAKSGGESNWPEKGLVRYDTAISGQNNFNLKYGDSSGSKGFFSKIIDNFLRTLPFVGALPKNADWKIRPEYSGKINVYKQMIEDNKGLLSYRSYFNTDSGRGSAIDPVNSVHVYSPIRGDDPGGLFVLQGGSFDGFGEFGEPIPPSRGTVDLKYIPSQSEYTPKKDVDLRKRSIRNVRRNIVEIVNSSKLGTFYPFHLRESFTFEPKTKNELYYGGEDGKPPENPNDVVLENAVTRFNREKININGKKYNYEKITDSFYTKSIIPYKEIGQNRIDKSETYESVNLESRRGFSSVGKPDEINILFPIEDIDGSGLPGVLKSPDSNSSKDLIYFYFYDVANKVYLPFRATIDSISDNNAVEWEDFQYIGRADHLYIYRGFTRDMNFNFTVHANSVFELQPMWHRINYLTGLTRPAKYTPSSIPTGEFIVPPLVKLRIGDLYVDLPIVIRSVGLTVPDSAIWELTSGKNYSYRGISSANATTAQLPMTCQLQINAAVLEKTRSEGGVNFLIDDPEKNSKMRFFGKDVKGFEIQNAGINNISFNPIELPVQNPSLGVA